jgi:DNA-binding response OmpR family regulator
MSDLNLSEISILVVERHQMMRGIMSDILRQFGVKNVTPSIGVGDAFAHFAEHGADLIISDWSPDVDAIGLVHRVRRDPLSKDFYVPFIVTTAFCDVQRVCISRDAGIHEFLAKPFPAQHLYCRIRSIVEQPRLFVRFSNYFGPDRRRRRMEWHGVERRAHANRSNNDRRTKKVPVHPDRRGLKIVDSRQDKRGSNKQQAA